MPSPVSTFAFIAALGSPVSAAGCDAIAPTMDQGASVSVGRMADLAWLVLEIGGKPVAEGAWLTVAFDGKVSGSTGCNRFTGLADLDAGVMEFGPLEVTEMGCDTDRMYLEGQLLTVLEEVRWFVVGPEGRLYLQRQDGAVVMCLG